MEKHTDVAMDWPPEHGNDVWCSVENQNSIINTKKDCKKDDQATLFIVLFMVLVP